MICQICGTREATIHLTEIVNNQMVDLHICEQCAKEKEVDLSPPLSFNELLSGLFDFTARQGAEQPDLRCTNCGLSYEAFKKTGRLSCTQCYESFRSVLMPLIKRVQGATQHMGKSPAKVEGKPKDLEIKELNERLKRHIEREEFEEAAQVRDKIKLLEQKRSKKTRKQKS